MLGRLQLSIDEAIEHYCVFSKQVFSKSKRGGDDTFKASELEKAIKTIVYAATQDTEARMMDPRTGDNWCKTYVYLAPSPMV